MVYLLVGIAVFACQLKPLFQIFMVGLTMQIMLLSIEYQGFYVMRNVRITLENKLLYLNIKKVATYK